MKKNNILTLFLPVLFLFSCSTDFEINADWKNIPVVYSLLNQSDTIQYVKLNKVFLGDADAYVMAQESDSIFYETAEVFLEPLSGNNNIYDNSGNKIRIQLEENNTILKDTGLFTNDKNLLYSTSQSLNSQYNYKLMIEIPGIEPISATTSLIEDFIVVKPSTNPGQKVNFYNGQAEEYVDYDVEFKPNEVGELYGVTLRFHYKEIYEDGSEYVSYIDWVQATRRRPATIDGNTEMKITLSGSSFFAYIASQIPQGEPSTKRVALGTDFIFMVSAKELALYIEVNGPSDGIIQERPAFTNIENGIGVFSSRFTKFVGNKAIHNLTLDEISCGEVTRHLRFADSNGNYDCLNN